MFKIAIIKDVANWRTRLTKFFELKKKEDKVLAKTNSKIRIASGNSSAMQLSMELAGDSQPISLPAIMTNSSTETVPPTNSKLE